MLFRAPSAPAVPVPSGTETKLQQVPLQLTRLPTTVDHTRLTGRLGVSPAAETSTFERTGPEVEDRLADALPTLPPTAASVVLASRVGVTATGQSMRCFGRPASFVTLNVNRCPFAHGIGDWGMLR